MPSTYVPVLCSIYQNDRLSNGCIDAQIFKWCEQEEDEDEEEKKEKNYLITEKFNLMGFSNVHQNDKLSNWHVYDRNVS